MNFITLTEVDLVERHEGTYRFLTVKALGEIRVNAALIKILDPAGTTRSPCTRIYFSEGRSPTFVAESPDQIEALIYVSKGYDYSAFMATRDAQKLLIKEVLKKVK